MDQAIHNIVEHHFPVAHGQSVLIVYDQAKAIFASHLRQYLLSKGMNASLHDVTNVVGFFEQLPSHPDMGLMVLTSTEMWGKYGLSAHFGFANGKPTLLTQCRPVFFDLVMPLSSMLRVYGSDYQSDRCYLMDLMHALPCHSWLRLTAPTGTDLTFLARDWQIDEGTEIHTSPVEESVNGRIVVDASVFFAKVAVPLELTIAHGRIQAITCQHTEDHVFRAYVEQMQAALAEADQNWQLAEVGIGGNSSAMISGCIMEDEAVRETCHFCFGDNTRYGGANRSTWHGGTVVVRQPNIEPLAPRVK